MPLVQLREAFDNPDWLFELKYDGFRALTYVENGCTQLVSRKGTPYKSFAVLGAEIASCLRVRDAVIGGEIVYLDGQSRPQFRPLLYRRTPQVFVAFDVLWLNGEDLRWLPLIERKGILQSLIPAGHPILFARYIEHRGIDLFRAVCDIDLQGVVAKHKRGLYTPDASTWAKIKNPHYSQGEGRRDLFEKRRVTVA